MPCGMRGNSPCNFILLINNTNNNPVLVSSPFRLRCSHVGMYGMYRDPFTHYRSATMAGLEWGSFLTAHSNIVPQFGPGGGEEFHTQLTLQEEQRARGWAQRTWKLDNTPGLRAGLLQHLPWDTEDQRFRERSLRVQRPEWSQLQMIHRPLDTMGHMLTCLAGTAAI